jgi:hypothetical protein
VDAGTEGRREGHFLGSIPPTRLQNLPTTLFAVGVVASGGLLLVLGSRLTFLLDDWTILLYRRGFTEQAILSPHGEHILIGPVLVYKALLAIFGMGSALPFRVFATAMFLASVVLLFIYLRRRVGAWLALIGATLILFLGPAWEDLLWPFQLGFFTGMTGGLAALLALERGDRRGDRVACLMLTIAIVFSSLGLPFIAGGTLQVLRGRDRWRRVYVVLVPLAVYGLWWIGWGHTAESALSLKNLATTPMFVVNGISAALASLLGLATPGTGLPNNALDWGRPLAVAVAVLVAWQLHRTRRVGWELWVVLAVAATFWILAGLNEIPGRAPTVSRYQYVGGIFVLLIAAELLRGIRLKWQWTAAVGVIAAAAVVSNVYYLHQAYESYRAISQLERADLGAVDIARATVQPGFILSEEIADTGYVHVEAGPYLSAVDEFGSPGYSPSELVTASAPARVAADKVLFSALGIHLAQVPASRLPNGSPTPARAGGTVSVPAGACVSVPPRGDEAPVLTLPRNGAVLAAGANEVSAVRMRRFTTEGFPIDAGALAAGQTAEVRTPRDGSTVPWKLQLESKSTSIVCALGPG